MRFIEDGIRVYGDPADRNRFDAIARSFLQQAGVSSVEVHGDREERYRIAAAAVERLVQRTAQA